MIEPKHIRIERLPSEFGETLIATVSAELRHALPPQMQSSQTDEAAENLRLRLWHHIYGDLEPLIAKLEQATIPYLDNPERAAEAFGELRAALRGKWPTEEELAAERVAALNRKASRLREELKAVEREIGV